MRIIIISAGGVNDSADIKRVCANGDEIEIDESKIGAGSAAHFHYSDSLEAGENQ